MLGMRRRQIILAVLAGLLLGFLGSSGVSYLIRLRQQQREPALIERSVSVLGQPVKEGEVIKKEMMVSCNIWTEPDTATVFPTGKDILGKCARIDLPRGTVVLSQMVREAVPIPDDLRLHRCDFIELNEKIQTGALVDVRIRFASGADYIVLTGKKVQDRTSGDVSVGTSDAIWFSLDEEELLRLSSAQVDMSQFEDCRLYAVLYEDDIQSRAQINYPVNETVAALLRTDPNVGEEEIPDSGGERASLEQEETVLHSLEDPGDDAPLEETTSPVPESETEPGEDAPLPYFD